MDQVLKPLIDAGLVEMTIPDNQRSKQESRMPGGGKNPNSGTSRILPRRKSKWRCNGGVSGGVGEGIIEGVNGGVSEGVNGLLEFIKRTPGLRTPQISKAMSVPVKTLEHWLKELRVKDKIEFRGSPKTEGYRAREVREGGISEGVKEGVDEGMGEGIKAVADFIQKTPGLRAPQISQALGVQVKTLERWLRRLKAKNQIEFRGSRRFGGYWKI